MSQSERKLRQIQLLSRVQHNTSRESIRSISLNPTFNQSVTSFDQQSARERKDALRQAVYFNQIKHKLQRDPNYIAKVQVALNKDIDYSSLREIQKVSQVPLSQASPIPTRFKKPKHRKIKKLIDKTSEESSDYSDSNSFKQNQNEVFFDLYKQNKSIIVPDAKSKVDLAKVFKQPQFAIMETPILQLMKSVKYIEGKSQTLPKVKKLASVPGLGLVGNTCQMHIQISNEIMNGLKRKKGLETSASTYVDKLKFKFNQDFKIDGRQTNYSRALEILNLEKQMIKDKKIQPPQMFSKKFQDFIASGQVGSVVQDSLSKSQEILEKKRLRQLEFVQKEYESIKLGERLQSQVKNELINQEILKFAMRKRPAHTNLSVLKEKSIYSEKNKLLK